MRRCRTRVVRELADCAFALRGAGATVALEFAPYSHLRTLAETIRICELVGWDRCGVLLDSWHFARSGSPWVELRALRADQVSLVHLDDAPEPVTEISGTKAASGACRRVPGRCRPRSSSRPCARLGYEGVVSAEVLSADLRARPPREGARVLVDALRVAWPEGSDEP